MNNNIKRNIIFLGLLFFIIMIVINFGYELIENKNEMEESKELLKKLDVVVNKKNKRLAIISTKLENLPIDEKELPEINKKKVEQQTLLIEPNNRKKKNLKESNNQIYYSPESEALRWLAEHQEPNGHWDAGKYEGERSHEVDCAVTGMALLAFLSNGYTSKAGKWKMPVKIALNWLIEAQRPNGSWATKNYTNAICTFALAEAFAMGEGAEAKISAELATDYILKQQNTNGLFDYTGPSTAGDMSVTGWCIMALKSSILADIKRDEIIEAYHKCDAFLNNAVNTKDNSPNSKGLSWYTPNYIGTGDQGGACQAIALVIRQYLGWIRTEPWILAAADAQIAHIPTHYEGMDIYRVYFSHLATYQQGGATWKSWSVPVNKIIVAAQRKDNDYKGSWDPNDGSCNKGGRVLYTAILCSTITIRGKWGLIMK